MSASAILELQAAGFSAEQVTALADLIDSQASSKSDLLEVEHRLEAKITEVKSDLLEVEHRLEAKIGEVKSDLLEVEHRLDAKIGDLRTELKADLSTHKIDMIKWMLGLLLAQTGLLIASFKLFLR